MRISKRKWTLFVVAALCVMAMMLLTKLQSDNDTLNPLISSFRLDMADLVKALLADGLPIVTKTRSDPSPLFPKTPINNFSFTFRVQKRSPNCISETFVLLIKSGVTHFKNRQIMRTHFTEYKSKINSTFRWFFFIGTEDIADRESVNRHIGWEAHNNSDLVQVNFIDTYVNNTLKLMSEIYWMKDNLCGSWQRKQRFIFMDDDVFINLRQINRLLSAAFERPAIFGHKTMNASPFRWRWSKWYISKEEYGGSRYPPYVSGSTIVTNREALLKISFIMPYVKYFPFDDVFLGIIAQLVGIDVINDSRILIDYKCGLFCYEDVDNSIAVHVPDYLSKLEELYRNNAKTFF